MLSYPFLNLTTQNIVKKPAQLMRHMHDILKCVKSALALPYIATIFLIISGVMGSILIVKRPIDLGVHSFIDITRSDLQGSATPATLFVHHIS